MKRFQDARRLALATPRLVSFGDLNQISDEHSRPFYREFLPGIGGLLIISILFLALKMKLMHRFSCLQDPNLGKVLDDIN